MATSGYAKLFGSIWGGSIYGKFEASAVFMVLLSLSDYDGQVDMTPQGIAGTTGWPLDFILRGIRELELPDPKSRSPDKEGRRIVLLDSHRDWGWSIVNFALYRDKLRASERRRYLAEKQRERRETKRLSTTVNSVNTVNHSSTSTSISPTPATDSKSKIAPPDGDAGKVCKERPQDLVWEATLEVCGLDGGTPTDRERKAWNGAVKSLKSAGATPGEIRARARRYRTRWPGISLTPTALARRWTECVAEVAV